MCSFVTELIAKFLMIFVGNCVLEFEYIEICVGMVVDAALL